MSICEERLSICDNCMVVVLFQALKDNVALQFFCSNCSPRLCLNDKAAAWWNSNCFVCAKARYINLRIMKKNFMLYNLSISLRYSLFKRYTVLKMCWYFIDVLTACDIYFYDDDDFLLLWLLILLLLLLLLLL